MQKQPTALFAKYALSLEERKEGLLLRSGLVLLDQLLAKNQTLATAWQFHQTIEQAIAQENSHFLISNPTGGQMECLPVAELPTDHSTQLIIPLEELLQLSSYWLQHLNWQRTRTFPISNGQGIIRLIHDDSASALYIQKPTALNWPDCCGSIGEYYAVSNYDQQQQLLVSKALNEVLSNGTNEAIFEQLPNFLELMENGDYSANIGCINLKESSVLFDTDSKQLPQKEHSFALNFYHWNNGEVYLATRPEETLDPQRIGYYQQQIQGGARPKAIVYTHHLIHHMYGYPHYYILDGHHKLQAYCQLKIDPEVVFISRDEALPEMSSEMLLAAVAILNPRALEHFIQHISDENPSALLQPGLEVVIDEFLKNQQMIDVSLCRLFQQLYQVPEGTHRTWVDQRLAALKENRYRNKGLFLYFINEQQNQWNRMPIDDKTDIDTWKMVHLEGGDLPQYMEKRLRLIREKEQREHQQSMVAIDVPPQPPRFEPQGELTARELILLITIGLAILSAFLRC